MLPDIAIGAVIAATITGIVSLMGLIISKEGKTSDFRQAWIDSLREEISTVITHAYSIHGSASAGTQNLLELWKFCQNDFIEINKAAASIELRLNPKEKESQALLSALKRLESAFQNERIDEEELHAAEKEILEAGQTVLKCEWKRVKSGENAYKFSRLAALLVMILGAITIFLSTP